MISNYVFIVFIDVEIRIQLNSILYFIFYFKKKPKQIDMEVPEFKDFAKEMVDYIGNYLENIRER